MHCGMTRRGFLETAFIGIGAMIGGLPGVATFAAGQTTAVAKTSKPKVIRLIPGLCAYSYGQELKHGAMTLEGFLEKAVELKVVAVDMTAYYLESTAPEYLYGLRRSAYKKALTISGAACGVNMVQDSPDKRAESLTAIKKWVDVTEQLGATHLRVFAGKLPSGTTLQQAVDEVVDTMKSACDYSARKGIILGLEDHVGVSQSADVCIEIMQRVDSPYAAINLDITNFIPTATQDAYAQIAACIPYATNTHIRDRFEDLTPVDMDRVWNLFATAGFQGYMSVEFERALPTDDAAATGVPKLVAETEMLCRKYSTA